MSSSSFLPLKLRSLSIIKTYGELADSFSEKGVLSELKWALIFSKLVKTKFHLDINADGDAVASFCERVMDDIKENPKTLKEDSSFCQVSMISATSLDVDLNLYWDVAGGVEERQERAKFIIRLKNIAEDLGIEFYDGRVRQQR